MKKKTWYKFLANIIRLPWLGITGAISAPAVLILFRLSGDLKTGEIYACAVVGLLLLTVAGIIGRETYDTVARIKLIFCETILKDNIGFIAMLCRSRLSNIFAAAICGLMFSTVLLVFVYIVPIFYFFVLFFVSLLYVIIRKAAEAALNKYVKPGILILTRRFTVTIIMVSILIVFYFGVVTLTPPIDLKAGTPDIPNYVIENVSHECNLFQHFVRTSAFIDMNLQSLRNIEEIGSWLYIMIFASFLSAVPMLAFTICVRFGYETFSGIR